MAKSMRSKSKRAFRRTKRERGVYEAVHSARVDRLSRKQQAKISIDKEGDVTMEEEEEIEELETVARGEDIPMPTHAEGSTTPKKISTSGPRGSRREEWRKSKGLAPRSKSNNRMNKQGVISSFKRAGRSKRRR